VRLPRDLVPAQEVPEVVGLVAELADGHLPPAVKEDGRRRPTADLRLLLRELLPPGRAVPHTTFVAGHPLLSRRIFKTAHGAV
jgi:hypothetical protein